MNLLPAFLTRIGRLLAPAQRREAARVTALLFIRALLDFAGLAALLPALLVAVRPDGRTQALALCAGALAFVAAKNAAIVAIAQRQSRFQLALYRDFSRRLFTNYYRRGLLFLRSRSSAKLTYEVNYQCYLFSLGVLAPLFRMASDVSLITLMVAALCVWKPLAALFLGLTFAALVGVYGGWTRQRLRACGVREMEARRRQTRTVTESFRGYAELQVADAFGTLLGAFDRGMDEIVDARLRTERYQLVPGFLSEAALLVGLALLIALEDGELGLMSGVLAVAAFRLVPAARALLNNWGSLQNALHTLDTLEEGLRNDDPEAPAAAAPEAPTAGGREVPRLELHDLAFRFADGHTLFSHLSLDIRRGERVGIRGASGSGKSTLFNLMLGFLAPTRGEVRVDGVPLTPANRREWHRRVGYVPQEIFIVEGSLADNVALGDEHPDRERVERVLAQVQLKDWTDRLPQGLDTELGEFGSRLSGGQKQRIGIARALYKRAEVLFFDEATSALDSRTERDINRELEQLSQTCHGLTWVVIAHRESSLAFCDRVIDLDGYKS